MSLAWQDDMATGIERIDEQHKGIFARFEAFKDAWEGGTAREELADLVSYLEDYTRKHFHDEEEVLKEAKYPDLPRQRECHGKFLDELALFRSKVGENIPDMTAVMDMKRLLIRWLIQHIKQEDMLYIDFVKDRGTAHNKETEP